MDINGSFPSVSGGGGGGGGGIPANLQLRGAGAPTNGVTGANVIDIGGEYVNTTNGMHYYNTGTKASPVWSLVIT